MRRTPNPNSFRVELEIGIDFNVTESINRILLAAYHAQWDCDLNHRQCELQSVGCKHGQHDGPT